MKFGPLTLLKKMHANGTPTSRILIAAWHWKWSLTWRWHLTWSPGLSGRKGFHFQRVYLYRPGLNFHFHANLPVLGSFAMTTQPNMDQRKAAHGITKGQP
jgi:hypothetical protein